jgi:hypothetical protein
VRKTNAIIIAEIARLTADAATAAAVPGATVAITLYRNGYAYGSGSATTAADGTVTMWTGTTPGGCYTTTLRSVTATGYVWDGVTPANRFCK